jgi:hypothetical protein
MLHFGEKQQMLYWDEVEVPNYWINFDPTPNHLAFKECWKKVNELALEILPARSDQVTERFPVAPASWYLKDAIQSE